MKIVVFSLSSRGCSKLDCQLVKRTPLSFILISSLKHSLLGLKTSPWKDRHCLLQTSK